MKNFVLILLMGFSLSGIAQIRDENPYGTFHSIERFKYYFVIKVDKNRKITNEGYKTLDSLINYILVDTLNRGAILSSPMPNKIPKKENLLWQNIFKYIHKKIPNNISSFAYDFYFRKNENPFIQLIFIGN